MTRLQEKYKDKGLVILAVNAQGDTRSILEPYVRRGKLTHKVLLGGRSVARANYQVRAFPTSFWLVDGKVVEKTIGFRPSYFSLMEKKVEKLLAELKKAKS